MRMRAERKQRKAERKHGDTEGHCMTPGSRYARHPGVGHKKKANRTNGTGRKQYGNIQGKEIQTERRQRKRYKKTTAQQKNRHRKLEKGGRQPGKHEASHNPTNLLKEDARCIKC